MRHKDQKKGILLEAGTNELEVIEFCVEDSFYAINIARVCEIIRADIDIVPVPEAQKSIDGAINLRGKIIPVINLGSYLKGNPIVDKKNTRIIVSEFNNMKVGFWVTAVARIHRLSWKDVEPPSEMLQTEKGLTVGVIRIETKLLFLLDFEKIAGHINSYASSQETRTSREILKGDTALRGTKVILIAEDSGFIRDMIINVLLEAGFRTKPAKNGEEVWELLMATLHNPDFTTIEEYYNLLITDLEMPQVDGLHLIKKIKQHPKLCKLPCVVFSSMITDKVREKCKTIGSDAEIAKPNIDKLVELVDKFAL